MFPESRMVRCIISRPIVNLPHGQAERDELFCSNICRLRIINNPVLCVLDEYTALHATFIIGSWHGHVVIWYPLGRVRTGVMPLNSQPKPSNRASFAPNPVPTGLKHSTSAQHASADLVQIVCNHDVQFVMSHFEGVKTRRTPQGMQRRLVRPLWQVLFADLTGFVAQRGVRNKQNIFCFLFRPSTGNLPTDVHLHWRFRSVRHVRTVPISCR